VDFLLLIVGLLVGAGGCYVYLEWKSKPPVDTGTQQVAKRFLEATKKCHSLSFAPYGLPEQARIDAYNALWDLAGLERKGYPQP